MLIFAPNDLCALARAYVSGTGQPISAVTADMAVNDKLFRRLEQGAGCHSDTLIAASSWFLENWPANVPWPEGVPNANSTPEAA